MKKTEHYQLNQWELSDRIMMEDFNADNAKIEAALKSVSEAGPKLSIGSYVGTGAYGQSNPCTLTFNFEPKLLIIVAQEMRSANAITIMLRNQIEYCHFNGTGGAYYGTLHWDANTVSWYSKQSALEQQNNQDRVYCYFAIG